MTVGELIKELEKHDPNQLVGYAEIPYDGSPVIIPLDYVSIDINDDGVSFVTVA